MAKGSKVIPVRIAEDLLKRLDSTINRVNAKRIGEPFDRSNFIRAAIDEKIAHYVRSMSRKERRKHE